MIFKELMESVNFNNVWKVLNRECKHKEGAYGAYQQVMEELQGLKVNYSQTGITLVVAKVENSFEPGTFTYDVFGIKKGDENHYALEMTPWEEWLNFNVLTKSIEKYGVADVVAHVLYEMTFFGYSAQTVANRVDDEKRILTERYQEKESGNAKFISSEDLKAELGITDKRTAEEKEEQRRQIERIQSENEKVYKDLLK